MKQFTRKSGILLLLLIVQFRLLSQVVSIDYILTGDVKKISKISTSNKDSDVLSTGFGEFQITDLEALDSIDEGRIAKIALVYTEYVQSETFIQPALNRKRLEYLKSKKPFIFENNLIEWEIVCQTGAKTSLEAEDYFHGFIVYYKEYDPLMEELSTEEELKRIDSILAKCPVKVGDTIYDKRAILVDGKVELTPIVLIDSIIKIPSGKFKNQYIAINPSAIPDRSYFDTRMNRKNVFRMIHFTDSVLMKTNFSKTKKVTIENTFIPRSKSKVKKGITYSNRSIWRRKPLKEKQVIEDMIYLNIDSAFILTSSEHPVFWKGCYSRLAQQHFSDTVVSRTLNNQKDWENAMIVEDVTGSMYPYLTQTFLWRRTNLDSSSPCKFVFFNDGDQQPDHTKVIGKTGGLYYVHSPSIDSVEFVAKKAMEGGNGGDCPENNLEALIYADSICPDCQLTMIADNNAPIKDLVLLDQIKEPVNIILCGVIRGRIQSSYLSLVNKKGGTIYTMEDELTGIYGLLEGETIEFGDQKFTLINGHFVLTR